MGSVNIFLRIHITWLVGVCAIHALEDFKRTCDLAWVVGAIDGNHIIISKTRYAVEGHAIILNKGVIACIAKWLMIQARFS